MEEIGGRVLPHSIEAEQSVLGSILLKGEAIYTTMEILRPEDFYREGHRYIYEVMLKLVEKGEPVDLITVTEKLRQKQLIEIVGGSVYVAALADSVPTAANVDYYAKIVSGKALVRDLIRAGTGIAQKGYEEEEEPHELLDMAETEIFALAQKSQRKGFILLKEVLEQSIELIEQRSQGKIENIPTFQDLDRLLNGLHSSDLVICAARPGMGKTSFCLNIAQNASLKKKIPVALFSLEMSKEQLALRMLSSETMINQQKISEGNLEDEDWEKLIKGVARLAEAPIYIDDTPGINALEIRAKARRLKSEHGLGLVIVDYLQLMQSYRRVENRQQEISEISRALKSLARELEVPVLALSQLSRAVEQTSDKRPNLSHLRESGALEQDSDAVIFIHRPEYYDPDTDKKGIAEIIVAKHRNGPVGKIEMAFLAEYTKFVDLAPEDWSK